MKHPKRGKLGLTLVEILIVVLIISVLSSIAFSSLKAARIKARDAQRISDLEQIKAALTLYYNDYGYFPVANVNGWVNSSNTSYDISGQTSAWSNLENILVSGKYLTSLPKDPLNRGPSGSSGVQWPWSTGRYTYAYTHYATDPNKYQDKYDLIAQLEDTSSPYRCGARQWMYHTLSSGETSWCGSYSTQMIADH